MKSLSIAFSLVFLCGCCGTKTLIDPIAVNRINDFRLGYLSKAQEDSLLESKQCFVFWNRQQTKIEVGDGKLLREVILELGSFNFFRDAKLVIVKRDQIVRRPEWFESKGESEHVTLAQALVIEPGDVLFFRGVE